MMKINNAIFPIAGAALLGAIGSLKNEITGSKGEYPIVDQRQIVLCFEGHGFNYQEVYEDLILYDARTIKTVVKKDGTIFYISMNREYEWDGEFYFNFLNICMEFKSKIISASTVVKVYNESFRIFLSDYQDVEGVEDFYEDSKLELVGGEAEFDELIEKTVRENKDAKDFFSLNSFMINGKLRSETVKSVKLPENKRKKPRLRLS